MYPFDNMVVQLDLTGAELRQIVAREVFRLDRRAGLAGMHVVAVCEDAKLNVTMTREDGSEIEDHEMLEVMTTDFLASGGDDVFTPIIPAAGFPVTTDALMVREAIADWMRRRGGRLNADTFSDAENPRWTVPESVIAECSP